MTCAFCDNGRCILCQLAQPTEIGISSSHGRIIRDIGGDLGDGNRRTPKRKVGGDPRVGSGLSGHGTVRMQRCPLCGASFKNLHVHYHQKHPEERRPT